MNTDREDSCVKTEAEIEVILPQAKGCQEFLTTTRSYKEARKDSSLEPLEGAWPCQCLDFCLLVSRTVSKYISLVLSHLVSGNMLKQF